MAAGSIRKIFLSIQDAMRRDPGIDGDAQRVGQLAWMLFLKVLEDREVARELASKRYRSPIPPHLRWREWAGKSENLTGDDLLQFVNGLLFPGLAGIESKAPLAGVIRSVFEDARNYMKSGYLMREVLDRLDELDLGRLTDRREIANTYEQFLADLLGARNAGEFYTPRGVTEFMVDRIDPRLGERVLDPACGTGGFLVCTIEHLRKQAKDDTDERRIQENIEGIEKKALPHLLCVTNLLLHGIDVPTQVVHGSALREAAHLHAPDIDVILTNPPFGGTEEQGVEDNFPQSRTRGTGDLILALVLARLREDGGRAAIVVPDGTLSGEGVKTRLKERLLADCNLHTIVRLPKGAFAPYTNIKTNLLFFTKGEPTKTVWYYEHPYPPGQKSYTKNRPLRYEEFEEERRWWGARSENDHAWKVSIEEIKARNYNLDSRRPRRSAVKAPTRILWLKLGGFRGFESLALELPRTGPTVLVGVNGAGKSSVLDAIGMPLSLFTTVLSALPPRHSAVQLDETDIKAGRESAVVEVMLRVGPEEQVWDLRTTRTRGVGTAAKRIVERAEALRDSVMSGETDDLPVLCLYPATRSLDDRLPASGHSVHAGAQLDAYERAFGHGPGPFQDFTRWFREEEDAENERRLRVDPRYRNRRLETVRRALERFLGALEDGHFKNLRMERLVSTDGPKGALRTPELVMDKDGARLSVRQLSEGERNTLLLVSDLARRFAVANPGLEDPLQGEGIVLIDEIDLHLHPAWQRGILPALCAAFPNCQFIATTHSPQALSRVPRENVFILEDFSVVRVTPPTYGRDTNSILGEVMGTPERPRDIEEKIHRASILIDEERLDEAKAALQELASILGDRDNVVVRLRTLASFLADRS